MKNVRAQGRALSLLTEQHATKVSVSTAQLLSEIIGNTQPLVTGSQKDTCHPLSAITSKKQYHLLGIPGSWKQINKFVYQALLTHMLHNVT